MACRALRTRDALLAAEEGLLHARAITRCLCSFELFLAAQLAVRIKVAELEPRVAPLAALAGRAARRTREAPCQIRTAARVCRAVRAVDLLGVPPTAVPQLCRLPCLFG